MLVRQPHETGRMITAHGGHRRSPRSRSQDQRSPPQLSVKATFGADIRRFPVSDFTELKRHVQNLFQLSGPFDVKYKDNDGDWVGLSCDVEMQEAWSCTQSGVLVVQITAGQEKNSQELAALSGRLRLCSLS